MYIKNINFNNGKNSFIYVNEKSSSVINLGLVAGEIVEIKSSISENKVAGELVLVDSNFLKENEVGLSQVAFKKFNEKEGTNITMSKVNITSFQAVIDKSKGIPFKEEDLYAIMKDIIAGYYSDAHIAFFSACCESLNLDEITYMTRAMVNTGQVIQWPYDIIVDKHCLGGIPANRTTNVVIPIVAAYGLHIPKTSSRAITSPSGTADTMEVLTNIDFSIPQIQEIVNKTNGCILWNGKVRIAPADPILCKTKKMINADPVALMAASILAIKIAAGSTDILIVVPVGPTAKIKSMTQFQEMKTLFESVGKKLNVNVLCEYEDGTQPVGNGVGPALEAKDILKLFKNEADAPQDLKEISLHLAGKIIEFDKKNVKPGEGYKIAKDILESGKAYKKFMEIIEAQGGLKQIPEAQFKKDITADKSGKVVSMDNKKISKTCRILGCPEKKASGVYLYKHLDNEVKKGDVLYTLYAVSEDDLNDAIKYVEENNKLIEIK